MPQQFLITINFQVNDLQLFEDVLKLTIPLIKNHPKYAWVVEKDETPSRHFHAYIDGKDYKDSSKLKQYLLKTEIKKSLSKSNTVTQNAYNIQISKDLGSLGYIFKDPATRRETNIPNDIITNGIELYHAKKRLEASEGISSDTILITPKNIHAYYKHECLKDPSITTENFQWKMTLKNYSFLNISQKQTKLFTQEQRLLRNPNNSSYKAELTDYQLNEYDNTQQKLSEALEYIKYNMTDSPDELPNNIKFMLGF